MPLLAPSPLPPAAKVWFRTVVPTLLGLLAIYLVLHSNAAPESLRNAREEIVYLSNTEYDAVVTLLDADTANPSPAPPNADQFALRKEKVFAYLVTRHTFRDTVGRRMRTELAPFDTRAEFRTALKEYPLRVKSFFWLADTWIYTEILFWSMFGVLASLLYSVSEALRTGGEGFNRKEVPSHWAKLAYTPFSVLIIYLSINLFGKGSLNNVAFSAWQIVLAFVLGFFSGRTMELLNRLKDLVLPLNRTDSTTQRPAATYTISGKVTVDPAHAAGVNLPDITVKLLSLTDARLNAVKNPEADGTFAFKELPAGDYHVVAELAHTLTPLMAEQPVHLDGQTPEPLVDLLLQP